jgi:hypothetical protein
MKVRLLCLVAAVLIPGFTRAANPIVLSPAEGAKEGRRLVTELLAQKPAENATNTGVLRIRDGKGQRREIPVRFQIQVSPPNSTSTYETTEPNGTDRVKLSVVRVDANTNEYRLTEQGKERLLTPATLAASFAGSDFWAIDLGVEFLHWPDQRVLRKEIRRGQSCAVLESKNPQPGVGPYSRVVSWIDIDSGGIINAEAYDAQNKLLKEFTAKKVKKIEGEWQLKEIEIENTQTDSSTRMVFDLGAH